MKKKMEKKSKKQNKRSKRNGKDKKLNKKQRKKKKMKNQVKSKYQGRLKKTRKHFKDKKRRKEQKGTKESVKIDAECVVQFTFMLKRKDIVSNFQKQSKRIESFFNTASRKLEKKNVFQNITKKMIAIGGGNELRNRDLVTQLCELLQELRPSSARYADLITSVPDRPGHDRRYAIDNSKITRELQWEPQEDFHSGLRKTVQWYLKNSEWCERVRSGAYRHRPQEAT